MAASAIEAGVVIRDWFLIQRGAVCSVADGLRPGPTW
jgi:hypothetical protein